VSIYGDVAKDLLKRFPDKPIRQLSRIAYKENPKLFMNLENAYQRMRYWTGTQGQYHRKQIKPESIRPPEQGELLHANPFGLPESDNNDWSPIKFPIKKGRGILLYDLHLPYHDVGAITVSLQWSLKNKFSDFIVFAGDLLDCYQLSKFENNPGKRDFASELDILKKFFIAIRKKYTHATIIWKHGNHESRFERYLKRKAPELFGLKDFVWRKYLDLDNLGIDLIKADIPMYVGKLNIIHGHEMPGSYSVVNPARGAYLKAMECIIEGHYHRTSLHAEKSFSGRLDTAWSVGCLCNLNPEYARINKWNHGFAAMEVDGKDFTIRNWRIIEGTLVR
jgi:predicted phosphodiesterase